MSNSAFTLNEDHRDMLGEIFNMGMGQSLGALSKFTGKDHEIIFELPRVRLIEKSEFTGHLSAERLSMVVQDYSGGIVGKAFFYFPVSAGRQLARLLIGSDIPLEQMEKVESDALLELGNIFINSSLECLSSFLGTSIKTHVPEFIYQSSLYPWAGEKNTIIHLSAGFNIKHLNLRGDVALILDDESLQKFISLIDAQLGEL